LDKESSRTTALLFDLSQGRHCAAPQDAGSFGLSDFEDSHDVANAELPVVEEQPEHLKPRFIGKDFKEPGGFSHWDLLILYAYIRFNECSQGAFGNRPRVELKQNHMFSRAQARHRHGR
jgi:hypothetical protein